MTTIDRIKALIADACGLPAADIADDAKLEDLKLDSLDRLQLVIEFEEHFAIDIPDEDIEKVEMGTPAGIAAYVDANLACQQVDLAVHDARFGGMGILKGGKRIDPADFYVEPVELVAETPAITPAITPGVTFRKKPVAIEAVRFVGILASAMFFDVTPLPAWVDEALAGPEGHPGSVWPDYEAKALKIGTIDPAIATAHDGDWIIRGTSGEIYPCKADIFAATYEPVAIDDGGDAHEPL